MAVALREAGFRGTIVGGAPAARTAFRRAAGAAAEGVVAPILLEPGPSWEAFASSYTKRWGEPPDEAAGHGYDAARLVAAAVREAGLNRARIRDAVRALAPWAGRHRPRSLGPAGPQPGASSPRRVAGRPAPPPWPPLASGSSTFVRSPKFLISISVPSTFEGLPLVVADLEAALCR